MNADKKVDCSLKNIIGVGKKFCLIPFLFRKREQNKLIDGVPTNISVGMPFFVFMYYN